MKSRKAHMTRWETGVENAGMPKVAHWDLSISLAELLPVLDPECALNVSEGQSM